MTFANMLVVLISVFAGLNGRVATYRIAYVGVIQHEKRSGE